MPKPPVKSGFVAVVNRNQIRSGLRILKMNELKEQAQTALSAFKDSMRKSVGHARAVGEALNELKKLVKEQHGKWEPWLKENFRMSKTTAEVYMRIDRNWDRIAAEKGDSIAEMSLADIRWYLSKPRKEATTAPAPESSVVDAPDIRTPDVSTPDIQGASDVSDNSEPPRLYLGDDDESQEAETDAPRSREYRMALEESKMDEFKRRVRALRKHLGTDNDYDTIYRAVEICFEEKCRA